MYLLPTNGDKSILFIQLSPRGLLSGLRVLCRNSMTLVRPITGVTTTLNQMHAGSHLRDGAVRQPGSGHGSRAPALPWSKRRHSSANLSLITRGASAAPMPADRYTLGRTSFTWSCRANVPDRLFTLLI